MEPNEIVKGLAYLAIVHDRREEIKVGVLCVEAVKLIERLQAEMEERERNYRIGVNAGAYTIKRLQADLEASKRREMAAVVERDNYKCYFDDMASKPDCNTCADKTCKYRPMIGTTVRANCPLWRGPEQEGGVGRHEE